MDQTILRVVQCIGANGKHSNFFALRFKLIILGINPVYNHFSLSGHAPPVNGCAKNHSISVYDLLDYQIRIIGTDAVSVISFAPIAGTAAAQIHGAYV